MKDGAKPWRPNRLSPEHGVDRVMIRREANGSTVGGMLGTAGDAPPWGRWSGFGAPVRERVRAMTSDREAPGGGADGDTEGTGPDEAPVPGAASEALRIGIPRIPASQRSDVQDLARQTALRTEQLITLLRSARKLGLPDPDSVGFTGLDYESLDAVALGLLTWSGALLRGSGQPGGVVLPPGSDLEPP